MKRIFTITFLVLLLDQISKIYIKTNFELGESVEVFSWFRFTFVENPGMAYGVQFGGLLGKYLLVIIRVVLIVWMFFYFKKSLQKGASNYLIVPLAMVFAGAIGNLIDGMFYGMIFDKGTVYDSTVSRWIDYEGISSFGSGYSGFMKGCVVDMFHFPLVDYTFPESTPILGGVRVEFFKYIFNIADSAITVGAMLLLLFRKKAFPNGLEL